MICICKTNSIIYSTISVWNLAPLDRLNGLYINLFHPTHFYFYLCFTTTFLGWILLTIENRGELRSKWLHKRRHNWTKFFFIRNTHHLTELAVLSLHLAGGSEERKEGKPLHRSAFRIFSCTFSRVSGSYPKSSTYVSYLSGA